MTNKLTTFNSQGVTKEDLERAEQTLKQASIDTRLSSSSTSELSDKENKPDSAPSSIHRRLDDKDVKVYIS